MSIIPRFSLYGEKNPEIEEKIHPNLGLRNWSSLENAEKLTAYRELLNNGWLADYSPHILTTIEYLNDVFLRTTPGRALHQVPPRRDYVNSIYNNEAEKMKASREDFENIILNESDALVYRTLSVFAKTYIENYYYDRATETKDINEREQHIKNAFQKFDALANCLNHIFEQFAVNMNLTRNGLIPRQDEKLTDFIYIPTLKALSDPKYRGVSEDLGKMFEDYQNGDYPEAITKAHRSVQRFLQILVGEEGKNGHGEMSKLLAIAKKEEIIPINRFTEPLIAVLASYFPSERATNSTAKPTVKTATLSDALLMINLVMVFMQHCLQKAK